MAISFTFSAPLRLTLALVSLTVASCSSGSAGEDDSTDGRGQHIDEPKAGSAGDAPGAGGTGDRPGPDGEAGAKGGGDDPGSSEGGVSGQPDPEPTPPSEEFLRGQALVEHNECATCHQADFSGFTVFPNITPDETTGIGSWTDEQIITAIRDGVDTDGKSMCATMMRYSFEPEQLSDVVAFLRGIPPVKHKVTSQCPGHGQ